MLRRRLKPLHCPEATPVPAPSMLPQPVGGPTRTPPTAVRPRRAARDAAMAPTRSRPAHSLFHAFRSALDRRPPGPQRPSPRRWFPRFPSRARPLLRRPLHLLLLHPHLRLLPLLLPLFVRWFPRPPPSRPRPPSQLPPRSRAGTSLRTTPAPATPAGRSAFAAKRPRPAWVSTRQRHRPPRQGPRRRLPVLPRLERRPSPHPRPRSGPRRSRLRPGSQPSALPHLVKTPRRGRRSQPRRLPRRSSRPRRRHRL